MSIPAPHPLPENAGFAFLGEPAWAPALLSGVQAEQLMAATNRCGRPNSDVLRRRLAVSDGEAVESWQIDFPDHFTAQEAALYEKPFAWLIERSPGADWTSPHARPALRRALARVSRFLAIPADATVPEWRWIADDLLPDASLVVVARDEDFIHGVLQSEVFARWWDHGRTRIGPVQRLESFPFPWPPATALSALTTSQEEQRHAIARSARSENTEQLNRAVLSAYGWPEDVANKKLLEKLTALNRQRSS